MSARVVQFPKRSRLVVSLERDRDGGDWLVIHAGNAWPCSTYADALREARELAAMWDATLVAEVEAA